MRWGNFIVAAMLALTAISPVTAARNSDKEEVRKEALRQKNEARAAESRAEAAERGQKREEREARRNARAEERRQEEAQERAREKLRDRNRDERKNSRASSEQPRGHNDASSLYRNDGIRYKRDDSAPQRSANQPFDEQVRQSELARIQREVDELKNSASFKRLNKFTPEEIAEFKRQGRWDEVNRYIDKGGRKPELENETRRVDGVAKGGDDLREQNLARKAESLAKKSEHEKLDAIERRLDQIHQDPRVQRLNQFTPAEMHELKQQGKGVELNNYIANGGRKPQIDVFDEKRGHWVSDSDPSDRKSPTSAPPRAAGVTNTPQPAITPLFSPQAGRPTSTLQSSDVFRSPTDQGWLTGLNRQQRQMLDRYPPEQLMEIQRSGNWKSFKQYIAENKSTTHSNTIAFPNSTSPSLPPVRFPGQSANSTPPIATPDTPSTALPVVAAASVVGLGIASPVVLPAAAAIAEGGNTVYVAIRAGKIVYVGITNNLRRRIAEHAFDSDLTVQAIDGLTSLVRTDARAVEQVLIERYGLARNSGQLMNKINSIAKDNEIYEQAIDTGKELLKGAGWPGF